MPNFEKEIQTDLPRYFSPQNQAQFVTKHQAARILGVSPHTLKLYRRNGTFQEGIHYVCWNSRVIRYNKALIEDWAVNCGDLTAHQRTIDNFLSALLSNQKKTRRGAAA